MADNKIYEELVYQINNLLKQGELYPKYVKCILGGKNDYKISQVYNKRNYSTDWIDHLEDCVVALDTIVRNPRRFIVVEEDIVDISLARSISVESIKHLAQHTNFISAVDEETETVTPSKILNTSKEESFEIYENRFIYTLLLKIRDFIDIRMTAIQNALMQSGEIGIKIESEFSIDDNKVSYNLESNANFPFDPAVSARNKGQRSNIERVVRIKNIISDFLSSPFAKEMRTCALVRPPILRTNVILKDPNFKKALVLWQFIETAEKMDFNIEVETETTELNPALSDKYRSLIYLNTILMQSISGTRDDSETLESARKKDKIIADEYITKNIDDYVPDDFPQLKLDLEEIRRVYTRIAPKENPLSPVELGKLIAAVDRVLRQARINSLREESAAREKLIAKQAEEEARAKRLALREENDRKRRQRHEEARLRIEERNLERKRREELKRLELEAEAMRKKQLEEEERRKAEREKEILSLKAEIAKKKYLLDEMTKKRQDYLDLEKKAKEKFESAKKDYDESIAKLKAEQEAARDEKERQLLKIAEYESTAVALQKEAEILKAEADEEIAAAHRMEEDRITALNKLIDENNRFWEDFKKSAVDLGVQTKLASLNISQREIVQKFQDEETWTRDLMKELENAFCRGLNAEKASVYERLLSIAKYERTDEEINRIMEEYEIFRTPEGMAKNAKIKKAAAKAEKLQKEAERAQREANKIRKSAKAGKAEKPAKSDDANHESPGKSPSGSKTPPKGGTSSRRTGAK